jgi:MtN3 and saliva related transmembrane protein
MENIQLTNAIGLIAGGCTTMGFIPQLLKAFKSKSTKDISILMLIIITAGIALWLVYGFMVKALPVIVANFATLIFVLAIFVLKVKYK